MKTANIDLMREPMVLDVGGAEGITSGLCTRAACTQVNQATYSPHEYVSEAERAARGWLMQQAAQPK